ncbi:MAG TPA: GNAT family N-acetyltransferase [Candidatus Blautia gallistercoris]|uniref:GNAT family N-acetyltransferase n=1 Tax=Candidatus Blautia gallistercoris TaxID=2838490 RepID=A0A9D2B2U6_9FIRM|nr:GNAT family N-acetyltransferase [Candidatus Blautia gallistercoris]
MRDYFLKQDAIGLRGIRKEDQETFLNWHNDSELREKIGGIFPFTEGMFEQICRGNMEDHPADVWFAICRNDRLIGIAGLHSIKYIQRNAELSLLIGNPEERRRGSGSLSLQLIEVYAFKTLQMHRLYARVYGDNQGAQRFLKKCHWRQEGILREASFWKNRFRDVEIWAKLEGEGDCYFPKGGKD